MPRGWSTRTATTRRRTPSSPRRRSSAARGGRSDPAGEQDSLLSYVRALEAGGRYKLTVWPYHAMLGSIGHALVSAIDEAVFFHGIARQVSPEFEIKGDDAHTEHYSVLGPGGRRAGASDRAGRSAPDIPRGRDRRPGQEPLRRVDGRGPALSRSAGRVAVYLLEDCTSPVVVPGAADFTDEANWAFARFADRGVNIVDSERADRHLAAAHSGHARCQAPEHDLLRTGSTQRAVLRDRAAARHRRSVPRTASRLRTRHPSRGLWRSTGRLCYYRDEIDHATWSRRVVRRRPLRGTSWTVVIVVATNNTVARDRECPRPFAAPKGMQYLNGRYSR